MKRFLTLASIVLVTLGVAACTREKPPVVEPTVTGPSALEVTPAVTPAPGGVASSTSPATLPTIAVTATVALPPAVLTATAPGQATPTIQPAVSTPAPTAASGTTTTAGATGVPTTAASPVAPGTATTYTVQWGDWLNKIAGQFGVSVQALVAANPGLNPNRIYPGQVLNIPAGGTAEVPTATPGATVTPGTEPTSAPGGPPPSTGPTTYTVQRGDWFYAIARKFGISVPALAAANPRINPNFVYPGQVLNIPARGTPGGGDPPGPGGSTYVVRPGDTLNAIAFRFGKTVYALQIANHLANPNFIYPGQTLTIP